MARDGVGVILNYEKNVLWFIIFKHTFILSEGVRVIELDDCVQFQDASLLYYAIYNFNLTFIKYLYRESVRIYHGW